MNCGGGRISSQTALPSASSYTQQSVHGLGSPHPGHCRLHSSSASTCQERALHKASVRSSSEETQPLRAAHHGTAAVSGFLSRQTPKTPKQSVGTSGTNGFTMPRTRNNGNATAQQQVHEPAIHNQTHSTSQRGHKVQPFDRGSHLQQPRSYSAPTASSASSFAVVDGVVKTITMQNQSTGYIVAKIKVAPGEVSGDKLQRKGIVTAVATHKQFPLGQRVRLEGQWKQHQKYGLQFQVDQVHHCAMSEKDAAVAMLQGAALPGVGPATAARLADHFGAELQSVMDSSQAAKQLVRVKGIAQKTAEKIKAAWDGTRGQREAAAFLQELGIHGKLLLRLVARHGEATRARMQEDPFAAMRNTKGVNLRMAEDVARQLGADMQLPSRAVLAICDVLLEAARQQGHTFLPWEQLQRQALQYLLASGVPWLRSNLQPIAMRATAAGDIVAELGEVAAPPSGDICVSHEESLREVEASLRAYLCGRIPGVGPKRAELLVRHFGGRVLRVLEAADAERQLRAVPRLSDQAAANACRMWRANPRKRDPGGLPQKAARPAVVEAWSGAVRCYHPEMHAAEAAVARGLARLAGRKPLASAGGAARVDRWIASNEALTGKRLSEGQKAAVRAAAAAPILILTGGPGCGKTFTTATIVKLWSALGREVKLAAPTGRASQRLHEMAGVPSSTIHRLLQYKAAGRGRSPEGEPEELEGSYTYTRANPLPAEAVLIDEAAMLDVTLSAALLQALPTNCQLVLVGDVDQLPSVGPGTVLSDAIRSGTVPVIDLREIFRQAKESDIVTAAHSVQRGEVPRLAPVSPEDIKVPRAGDMCADAVWVVASGAADGPALQAMVLDAIRNYVAPLGFEPKSDVQVLVPVRRGAAGVEAMNLQLQALLNPGKGPAGEIGRYAKDRGGGPVFRLGDRVIQTINNYEREVFNGDPGVVVAVKPGERSLVVEFPETDFDKVNRGVRTKRVEYAASSFWELDMAWATTVHKSQGGECPVVVILLSSSHRPLLTRRLLYTALTRAKNLVVVVGPEKAIRQAVGETEGDVRLSSLQSRLEARRLGVQVKTPQKFGAPDAPSTAGPASEPASSQQGQIASPLQPAASDAQGPRSGHPASPSAGAGPSDGPGPAQQAGAEPRPQQLQTPQEYSDYPGGAGAAGVAGGATDWDRSWLADQVRQHAMPEGQDAALYDMEAWRSEELQLALGRSASEAALLGLESDEDGLGPEREELRARRAALLPSLAQSRPGSSRESLLEAVRRTQSYR